MSDAGTNFPPQTYSSIFNLNTLTEGEKSEQPEEEPGPTSESPPILDCFASSMKNSELSIILFQLYIVITQAATCPPDNRKIQIFQTLEEYKNKTRILEGSFVSFKVDRFPKLNRNFFLANDSQNIVGLNLSNKSIHQIDNGALLFLVCLYHLDLSYNNITNLTTEVFEGLHYLKYLNIRGNILTILHDYVFSNLQNIQTIDVSHNKIKDMDRAAFFNITTLEKLVLSYNSMKRIRFLYFNELTNLRELYLDHNEIAVLQTFELFGKNPLLQKLDLSGNGLVIFGMKRDRTVLKSVNFLNLSDDYLITLNVSNVRYHFPNKNLTIDLNNNQFYCSNWQEYLKKLNDYHINIVPGRNFSKDYHIDGMMCDALNFTPSNTEKDNSDKNVLCECVDKSIEHNITNTVPKKMPLIDQKNVTLEERDKDEGESHSAIKAVTIGLAVIGTAFFIFLALDYVLGVGFALKMSNRFRRLIRPFSTDGNSDYITLQPPT